VCIGEKGEEGGGVACQPLKWPKSSYCCLGMVRNISVSALPNMFASCSCNYTLTLPPPPLFEPTPQLTSYHMANKHSHFSKNFRIISCFLFLGLTRKFYGRALHINESFCLILTQKAGLVMFLNVFLPVSFAFLLFWTCLSKSVERNKLSACRIIQRSANYLPHAYSKVNHSLRL